MSYRIVINKNAIKALEKISQPDYTKIKTAILQLADNPRPQGYIKLKNREGFRIRVGNYRIIYEINDTILLIDVINLGHRKDIYE